MPKLTLIEMVQVAARPDTQRYEDPALWSSVLWSSLELDHKRVQIMLASLPAEASLVLDVGCGNGVFTNLKQKDTLIYGLDSSYTALRHVTSPRCQASADAIPFPSGHFDAVVCMEMLEHLPVDIYQAAVSELARVSKDAILITVPYKEILSYSHLTCPACACEFHPYYHIRSYDDEDLLHLFDKQLDIRVEKISGICNAQTRRFPKVWDQIRRMYHRGGANFPWYARCPQCGYTSGAIPPNTRTDEVRPDLKQRLRDYWPRAHRYQWWLAVYRKRR